VSHQKQRVNVSTPAEILQAAADASAAQTTVAIVERLPAYRRGLAVALCEHGFVVEELAAPEAPTAADALALTVDSDESWNALGMIAEKPPPILALLENACAASYRRALRLGATGAVPREAPTEQIVRAICAVLAGTTLLPHSIARQLAEGAGAGEELPISESEARWLRAMAEGTTVATMAQGARYSERQMHRLIANLYKRIGAANRQQALVFAARCGILDY
jgi:DNA-binding NarL/FixJ family response regulator